MSQNLPFSRGRFPDPSGLLTSNSLTRARDSRHHRGLPILDLTLGNPTEAGLPYDEEAILKAFQLRDLLHYEPAPFGRWTVRETVCEHLRSRGIRTTPDRVILTASTSEAYSWLLKLLTDPGDEVITPKPSYPLLEYLAGLELTKVEPFALRYADDRWSIDETALDAALSQHTRACVVVHPNNPTGHYTSSREWELLLDRCARGRMALIVDEVFHEFAFGTCPPSSASLDSETLVFTLGGFSKSLGLPQMKLGWIVVGGPSEMADAAMQRLEVIADSYLSVGAPVQAAASCLLGTGPAIQAAIRERCATNLSILQKGLHDRILPSVEGGWYAAFRTGLDETDEATAVALVERDGILVHPGYFFDFHERDWMAVSLLPTPSVFAAGVDGMVSGWQSSEV